MTNLSAWGTFYEVLGSAGAALTGLQFVTIALLADIPVHDVGAEEAGDAFATPTIVHFVSALLLAAAGAAPWPRLTLLSIVWAATGVTGLAYTLIVIGRVRRQKTYAPVFEDWLFHALLPVLAYAGLAGASAAARHHGGLALGMVATAALLLLFTGVHNAWDNVTFIALRKRRDGKLQGEASE